MNFGLLIRHQRPDSFFERLGSVDIPSLFCAGIAGFPGIKMVLAGFLLFYFAGAGDDQSLGSRFMRFYLSHMIQ